MTTRSIKFQLIAWYAGLLSTIFVVLAVLMFLGLKNYLEASLRQTQTRRAQQIADTLLVRIKQTGEDFLIHEIPLLYAPESNGRFIRITRHDGTVLYASGSSNDGSFNPVGLPVLSLPLKSNFVRKQKLADGNSLLIATVSVLAAKNTTYYVEVGAPTIQLETMLLQFFWLLVSSLLIAMLLAIAGGYLLVNRALAPVDVITHKAEQITHSNLSERLPVAQTADELQRLSLSLNHMIERLEDAFLNSKRFVADASHELRTPLTVLRAEFENIVGDKSLPPQMRQLFGSVLEEVERLSRIVEQLFALSRLDAGEARAEWVQFDLAELVTTTTGQMSLLAEDKGITVKCEAPQPVFVNGDRGRLKQVVVNLLDNAIKYTPVKGSIALHVVAINNQAVLEVADTGIGIPVEAQRHVFERFFRVDKARSRDEGGAGLGLAIVKSICVAHGAEVKVESNSSGGSRFRVTLPLANGKRNNHVEKI